MILGLVKDGSLRVVLYSKAVLTSMLVLLDCDGFP